jgi:hypothetical protein
MSALFGYAVSSYPPSPRTNDTVNVGGCIERTFSMAVETQMLRVPK